MGTVQTRTVERLGRLRHYLVLRARDVRIDGNTARGLRTFIDTLDGVIVSHGGTRSRERV